MNVQMVLVIVSTSALTSMDHISVCVEMAMSQGETGQHVKVITMIVYQ